MKSLRHWIRRYLADEPYRRLANDDLWARFREHRDEAAFRVLLELVGGKLLARCRAVLGESPAVEDVFQESLIEWVRRRERLPNYGSAVAWLLQTATNKAKEAARQARNAKARELAKAVECSMESPPPDDFVLRRETIDTVQAALIELPLRERQALELVYFEGMTHAEAASSLGWSRGTIGTYVQRGLGRLRERLTSAGIGVGIAGLESALRASPPAIDAETLSRLTANAWAIATTPIPGAWWPGTRWAVGFGLVGGVGAAAILIGNLGRHNSTEVPSVTATTPTTARESLAARNRQHFETVARPKLQAALDGMVVEEGGTATITAIEFPGARVFIEAEVRHGPPQTHISRFRLTYCTHARERLYFVDPWGSGTFESANPRDPILLARNRLRVPDRTRPTLGLRAIHEAFETFPADPRGANETAAERAALQRSFTQHFGDWVTANGEPAKFGRDSKEFPVLLRLGDRIVACPVWIDPRLRTDGTVTATCGTGGGFTLSPDGTWIDVPTAGGRWTRPKKPGS